MLLLKFSKQESGGTEPPVGVISWFGIHPTDRGQKNTLVCGDNKGWASFLFESRMQMNPSAGETFVAAFANASAQETRLLR
jgi:neutral ceramidase